MKRSLRGITALAAVIFGLATMAQCPPGMTEVPVFFSDFESDNGGLVSGGGGDWEYGTIPVNFSGAGCESSYESPGGAYSGTKGWGTILDGCHHNLGAFSDLSFSVDLSNPEYLGAKLNFAQWYNVFVSFDYIQVAVNGTVIWLNNSEQDSNDWLTTSLDLASYVGQANVAITFQLYATTVVNRAGWYIDDVGVYACVEGTQGINEEGMPTFKAWPIPARGQLNIEPSGTVDAWILYDATGRVLAEGERGNAERFSIDVSRFHGMGVLELRTPDGLQRQRVVME